MYISYMYIRSQHYTTIHLHVLASVLQHLYHAPFFEVHDAYLSTISTTYM